MTPQRQQYQNQYPTSPWTEAFQPAPAAHPERHQDTASQQPHDADTQEPTHNALSDIYNRGY
ncbi:MAG: hypothetical protein H6672_09400 [Anaerolineaceae bacterium]|nr:hypothetical protein [Anaerolineaceae bacterium]